MWRLFTSNKTNQGLYGLPRRDAIGQPLVDPLRVVRGKKGRTMKSIRRWTAFAIVASAGAAFVVSISIAPRHEASAETPGLPSTSAKPDPPLSPASMPKSVSASPHNDYMLQCQGCHMADGRGSPGSVPDLRGRMGLFIEVHGGRAYLISVPGSAQSPLSNLELAKGWQREIFATVCRLYPLLECKKSTLYGGR